MSPLPVVPLGADLAPARVSWRWPALVFIVTFAVYVAFVPKIVRYESPPTGDQPFYLMDTISLVQDGDLNVANNYAAQDWQKFYALAPHPPDFVGMSGTEGGPAPMLANSTARPKAEQYSYHYPGLAVWLIPAWVVGSWFALWWPATIVFMCLLAALVAANIFLFVVEMTGRPGIGLAVWLPLAFSVPLMPYAYLIFTELPVGLVLIYVFRRLALGWGSNGPLRLLLIGAGIAYIPWLAWRCVLLAAPLGLYALVQWGRYVRQMAGEGSGIGDQGSGIRPRSRRRAGGALVLLLAPIVLLVGLLVAYHLFLFGRIIPDSSVQEQGNPAVFYWPWVSQADLRLFTNAALGLLFDSTFGLLLLTPVYVLAGVGAIALFRSGRPADRRLLGWIALLPLPYLFVVAAFEGWSGWWCPPARFLTTLAPLWAAPLGFGLAALSRGWPAWVYRALYALLALVGLVTLAFFMIDPRNFWPSSKSQIYDWLSTTTDLPITVDLRPFVPSFQWPDQNNQPWQTGWAIAAAVVIIALGYALLRLRRPPALLRRARPVLPGLAWLATLAIAGGGWWIANDLYLQHKTVLTEIHRWAIADHDFFDPRGIAYLDGKVYITAFGQRTETGVNPGELGAFDAQTEQYQTLQAYSAQGPIPWGHPADVQVGPDGLLWVLNNGGGDQEVLVMRPSGEVVRRITLTGKSTFGAGLQVGADGSLYVSDQAGGAIRYYSPNGGAALDDWGGMLGGMNNPFGVHRDPDGTIYTTEGDPRVQQLDANGNFVRKIDIYCKAFYFAAPPGDARWMDATCDTGVFTIDRTRHAVQLARVADGDPALQIPTGITYAPDGSLYLFDINQVIRYQVTH